jgi:DnaJ-class molecular chaperone
MSYEAWGDGDLGLGNCPECDGTGLVCDKGTEEDFDCPRCCGTGWIDDEYFPDDVI